MKFKISWLAGLIVLVSFVVSICLYSQMPENMASHWNMEGNANGYLPKMWAMYLLPIISLGLFLLFISIPKIDPLRQNILKFEKYYDWFIVIMVAFMLYLHLLTIVWNLGIQFNFVLMLAPAFGVLFYYVGLLLGNAKRNWFIGIRTPWTLSNEKVWEKTHNIGGKLFKSAGIVAFLGIIFPQYAIFFMVVPVLFVSIWAVAYSYLEYRNQAAKNPKE
jgi:uncharacterized membrane protein